MKMHKMPIISFIFFISFYCRSQTEKNSEGFAEVQLLSTLTPDQCKQKAIDQAKINAIENAFGSVVMAGNSLYTVNKETGSKTEFNQVFNSISDVYVNGEWVKDLEPCKTERITKENEIFYTCRVKGLVREIKSNPAKFVIKPMSCEKAPCVTDVFKSGQEFYLYFKAPDDGYISVYMDVPGDGTTFRLLPYKKQKGVGSYKVKGDHEYIFFSGKKPGDELISNIDEIEMVLTGGITSETNKLFVFYSPNRAIEKPILSAGSNIQTRKGILEMPLNLKTDEFQKWQQGLRKQNPAIQLLTIYITVKQ